MILAGDIGGTTTTLALFASGGGGLGFEPEPRIAETFRSASFAQASDVVGDFCARHRPRLRAACIGIAGPVRENRCRATNLPWNVDGAELAAIAGLPQLHLLNDLEAVGYAIDLLRPEEMAVLQAGEPAAAGNRAVIAAGTGLGEAGLFWDGRAHRPFATEGGHADFAPGDEMEVALLRFLQREHGRVSWERVVSGPGLVAIHRFLGQSGEIGLENEPPGIAEEMHREDPASVISRHASGGTSALCARTLELFVKLYAAEAGNLALKLMATGGLFIGGGIAAKNLAWMQSPTFLEVFRAKGRMRPLLEAMPVSVLLGAEAALLGAARRAAMDLR